MIFFNTKYWPLVYFHLDNKKITLDDFEEYKKTYLSILLKCKKEKNKIILISDLNESNIDFEFVIKQAKFNYKIEKFNKLYVELVCIYLKNNNLKHILKMYFKICDSYCPYKICKSYNIINDFIYEKTKKIYDTNLFSNLEYYIDNIDNNDNIDNIEFKEFNENKIIN